MYRILSPLPRHTLDLQTWIYTSKWTKTFFFYNTIAAIEFGTLPSHKSRCFVARKNFRWNFMTSTIQSQNHKTWTLVRASPQHSRHIPSKAAVHRKCCITMIRAICVRVREDHRIITLVGPIARIRLPWKMSLTSLPSPLNPPHPISRPLLLDLFSQISSVGQGLPGATSANA